jgi:hypothetical protein
MRTRQSNQILSRRTWAGGTYPRVYTTCAGVVYNDTRTFPSFDVVSEIRDERITDATGRNKSHACVHRLHTRKFAPRHTSDFASPAQNVAGTFGVEVSSGTAPWWDLFQNAINTSLAWDVGSDTGVPPYWSFGDTSGVEINVVNDLMKRAQQLKADVLLNLVEANQIWPSIQSIAGALPNMARHWHQLRKVIKTASGSFLAWKFGVSPILSDMMAVQRYLPRLEDDITRHIEGDKQRFSISMEVPCQFTDPGWVPVIWNGHDIVSAQATGKALKSPTVRYVLVVKPKASYKTAFFQKADAFLSRFATSPASLAWELVPFSFVVDWFVDLSGVARAVDKVVGHSPYEVVSFTRSLSYELSTQERFQYRSPCTGGVIADVTRGSATYKHYERTLVQSGSLPVWNPRFGKNQASISAALILQQLSRVR